MHLINFIGLCGLGAIAVATELQSACNSPGSPITSTIYVTVPATLVTETVYPFSQGTAAIAATTATVTNSLASTQINSAGEPDPGPYSFTEDNGTTSWMGGRTPPASAELITSTSFITLRPVSTAVLDSSHEDTAVTTDTPYTTATSPAQVTRTSTKSLIYYVPSVSASAKGYSPYSSAGWNASLTTFLKLKIAPTTSLRSTSSVQQSAIDNFVAEYTTAYVTPTAYGNLPRHRIEARQVGAVVVASIDGVDVSWTNSFDGSEQTISDEVPSFVPVTATAPSFGGAIPSSSSPYPSPVNISTRSVSVPSTTVAAYPWDLTPAPSPLPKLSTTTRVNTWTSLQPGLHPVPTISAFSPTTLTQSTTRTLELSNASTAVTSATPTAAASCVESSAMFTVNFDDLPSFSAGPDDTDIPPIFNPYRKLYWNGHYGYVPPPTDPFPPHSPPQLAVYRGTSLEVTGSSGAGLEANGEFGAGPRAANNAYWIDVFSAYLGCANGGPTDCILTFTAYTNEGTVTTAVSQPPCPGLKNCSLALVTFDHGFRGLTGFQIQATVNSKAVDYYMDDLQLGWSNNSCAAQQLRSSSE